MAKLRNEWDDSARANGDDTAPADEPASSVATRGPFTGLRRLIWWLFWIGLAAAIALPATGVTTTGSVVTTPLAYLVTIGVSLATAWGALWLVDIVLAYLKS